VSLLLIVLVLNVDIEVLDIFGFCVAAMLVQGQVVVCQLALVLAHVLDQHFVPALKREVFGVVAVDVIDLLLHLPDFLCDFSVLLLHEGKIIIAVVVLAAWSKVSGLHAGKTVVSDRPIDRLDLSVHTDTRVVDFSVHSGRLSHASS